MSFNLIGPVENPPPPGEGSRVAVEGALTEKRAGARSRFAAFFDGALSPGGDRLKLGWIGYNSQLTRTQTGEHQNARITDRTGRRCRTVGPCEATCPITFGIFHQELVQDALGNPGDGIQLQPVARRGGAVSQASHRYRKTHRRRGCFSEKGRLVF